MVGNIISGYLEHEDIKELEKEYINFKITKDRIREEKILDANGNIKEIITYVDDKLTKKNFLMVMEVKEYLILRMDY